jgi:hypothetical protein
VTQGWIASSCPLTADEFIAGRRTRRLHYCVEDGTGERWPTYLGICGRVRLAGRKIRVLPGKPSQGLFCERCERLYEETALAGERGAAGG